MFLIDADWSTYLRFTSTVWTSRHMIGSNPSPVLAGGGGYPSPSLGGTPSWPGWGYAILEYLPPPFRPGLGYPPQERTWERTRDWGTPSPERTWERTWDWGTPLPPPAWTNKLKVLPVVISACSSLRLNDFPRCLSIRITIRSMLIVLTVYKAAHSPVQSQKSSGATSTRPLHLRTNGTAVELQHYTFQGYGCSHPPVTPT